MPKGAKSAAVKARENPDGFMQRVKATLTAMPDDQLRRVNHKWSDPLWAHAKEAALPSPERGPKKFFQGVVK
jgi:hypothetical protein